jgi:glycosyltransferase involved in cell wall biosynthesis
VLGTALGGIPYLVGDAGWTVPAEVEALSAALPAARAGAAALGGVARARYLENFTEELAIKRLLEVYGGYM